MVNSPNKFVMFIVFLIAAIAWTVGVCLIDVQPIGPEGSTVGFATINGVIFSVLGTNALFDKIGDVSLLITIATCVVLLVITLRQAFQRRSLFKIDLYFWCLAAIFAIVLVLYILFSVVVINYRPVLEDGVLEASFPSSHTMAVITVMGCTRVLVRYLTSNKSVISAVTIFTIVMTVLMPISRLLAGVHWFSDIVAAALYGATLVWAFAFMADATTPVPFGRHSRYRI